MSSAADELPDGDDPAPTTVLQGTIAFLSSGGSLGTLLQGAIFGTVISVATGGINIIQSIIGLITAPIDALGEAATEFVTAIILEPLGIVSTTADASADAIADEFGVFSLLVGVAILLATMWLIIQFLEERETSDTVPLPGFPDIPFIGVTEEGERDDD